MSSEVPVPPDSNQSPAQPKPPPGGHLGIPISDDSSEDEQSQIRALEEEKGIYHHEEVVVSPKNESDDDIPLRRYNLSESANQKLLDFASEDHTVEEESDIINSLEDGGPNMERRRSVRFSGPHDEEEDGRNKHWRTPSPESLRYIKALENPMAANGDFEEEFNDMNDTPVPDHPHPMGSPPAYTSGDEGPKSPPRTPIGSSQSGAFDDSQINFADKRQESLNNMILRKISDPLQNMIRRASRLEDDSSNDEEDEEDEDDDDDYTEDEIAVLTYIDAYKAQEVELRPQLRAFTIEYIPSMGDVDLFIKVPRPDDIDDNVGLTQVDEPPSNQSDATIVDMQIRNATKDAAILDDEVPVKLLEKADQKPDEIKKWIADIKVRIHILFCIYINFDFQEFHKSKPAQTVHYRTQLPDIETLMQEWAPKLEEILKTTKAPSSDLDVPLEKYVDICLNLLDIPVGKSRIESLHLLFSLLNEFNNSQHFRNLAQNNNLRGETGETMDRLEL
ncbi:CRE-DYF-6 protein [Caenorhabditis remanei]|uniref:Intraflagellar transport protein 46 homolog n=1 Tax=Caenorhabditis remanei TaxID=31234 RepID=E3M2U5_CAERE|nr:CRE-DYF-6 protein [Caenorhabditis remanei]